MTQMTVPRSGPLFRVGTIGSRPVAPSLPHRMIAAGLALTVIVLVIMSALIVRPAPSQEGGRPQISDSVPAPTNAPAAPLPAPARP
jgi:hypothetical protein